MLRLHFHLRDFEFFVIGASNLGSQASQVSICTYVARLSSHSWLHYSSFPVTGTGPIIYPPVPEVPLLVSLDKP